MKDKEPLSFRLEPELHQRLEECSKRLRVKKYTLALLALEAAVDAVERNDYRIALPIQFEVTHVVAPKTPAVEKYPDRVNQPAALNEGKNAANSTDPEAEVVSHLEEDLGGKTAKKKRAAQKSPQSPAA